MTARTPIDIFIDQQPDIVLETLGAVSAQLSGWSPPALDSIALVGSGSSLNALTVVADILAQTAPVRVIGPSAFLDAFAGFKQAQALVLLLSQTGTSTTTIEAAAKAHGSSLITTVLTAEAKSPIAATGARIVLLPVGPEHVGPKTKGYTASIAGLTALAAQLGGPALPAFDAGALAAVIARSRMAADDLAQRLDRLDFLLVAGQKRHLGTALEGSLKVTEMAGVPAAAFETEEVLHGRLHGLTPNSLCLLIVATGPEREIGLRAAEAMAARNVAVRLLNLSGAATAFDWPKGLSWPSASFDTLAAIVPFQCLAVALAMRRGLAPHAMRYPGLSQALAIKTGASE